MRVSSTPYLRPYPERIQVRSWHIMKANMPLPLTEFLPEWDAATDLVISVTLDIDVLRIWEDCHLPEDAVVRLVPTWESGGTGLRGCGNYIDLILGEPQNSLLLEMNIEGNKLASEVVIGVSLILATPVNVSDRVVPKIPGSLLWRNQRKVILEGTGARFPIEIVDFAKSFSWLPGNAAWFLDWDRTDFTRPVLGSVRLYINSNHKRLRNAVSGVQEADLAMRETVYFDVARTMIMSALDNEDFLERADSFTEETVGVAVMRLIKALFSNDTLNDVANYRKQHPERFECELQERLKLFWRE